MHNEHEPLDRALASALDALDYRVSAPAVATIVQRARARRAQRRLRYAAAAVVLLASSAAAALPGSPVRRWVEQAFGGGSAAAGAPVTPAAPRGASEPQRAPDMRGVVLPVQDSLIVEFTSGQATGAVIVRIIPDAELRLSASDSTPRFIVRQGGVAIGNPGSQASYELAIWEGADLRIFVGGVLRFRRAEGRVLECPEPQDDGSIRLPVRGAATR
jgi:hypothetical protein